MKTEHSANFFLFLAIFSCFFFLAISFFVANGILFPTMDAFFHENISSMPELFASLAFYFGGIFHPISFFAFSVLVFGWLFRRKEHFPALLILGAVSFSILSAVLIKEFFEVVRPENVFFEEGWSFPSIHATAASAFCFTIVFLFKLMRPKTSSGFAILLPIFVLLATGVSRVFAGVHWFSDVFGGIFLGLFWFSLVAFLLNFLKLKKHGYYS